MLNKVDLPQPLGPMIETNSFAFSEMSKPSMTGRRAPASVV
jgi:hypothetical protein